MSAVIAVGVFLSALLIDFAAARYTAAMQHGRPHVAARWSVVMHVATSFGIYAFAFVSPWMLLPECLGLYIGTVLGGIVAGASTE